MTLPALSARVRQLADAARNNAYIVYAEGVPDDEREIALMLIRAEAEIERLREGYCSEAYIVMVQTQDVKALGKGRKRILAEQARRMASVGLGQGTPRSAGSRDRGRELAEDVLARLPDPDALDEERNS